MHPEAEAQPAPESRLFNERPNTTSVPSDIKALLEHVRDANDLLDQKRIEAVQRAKIELERKYDFVEEKKKNEAIAVAEMSKRKGKGVVRRGGSGNSNGNAKSEARRRKKEGKKDRLRTAVLGGSDQAASTRSEDVIEAIEEEVEVADEADVSLLPGDDASVLGMIGDESTLERDQAFIDASEAGVDGTEEETTTPNASRSEYVPIPDTEAINVQPSGKVDSDDFSKYDSSPQPSHDSDATVEESENEKQEAVEATDLILDGKVWDYVKKLMTQKSMLMALVMAKTGRTGEEIEGWLEQEWERV